MLKYPTRSLVPRILYYNILGWYRDIILQRSSTHLTSLAYILLWNRFQRNKLIELCKPTSSQGHIWQNWEKKSATLISLLQHFYQQIYRYSLYNLLIERSKVTGAETSELYQIPQFLSFLTTLLAGWFWSVECVAQSTINYTFTFLANAPFGN